MGFLRGPDRPSRPAASPQNRACPSSGTGSEFESWLSKFGKFGRHESCLSKFGRPVQVRASSGDKFGRIEWAPFENPLGNLIGTTALETPKFQLPNLPELPRRSQPSKPIWAEWAAWAECLVQPPATLFTMRNPSLPLRGRILHGIALFAFTSIALGALTAAEPQRDATPPPARPAGSSTQKGNSPPQGPAVTPPAASPDASKPTSPPHADDANAELPEGLKVRDPGKRPDFKGGPAIYFDEIDHDFGPMTNAETKHHRFTFVNAGNQPLVIEAVVPKCGCTRPTCDLDKVYQPGESGYIDIDFTPPTGGHQAKAIVVKSNAAWPSEVFNIRVIGKVESVLSFEPKTFDFGEVRRGQPWTGEVKVVADAKATVFDSVRTRSGELRGEFIGEGPHQGEVTIKLQIDANVKWGSFKSGVLMITTRGKDEGGQELTKSLPFRVAGTIVDEIRASAYIFQMDTVRPGNSFSKSVFLSHEEGKPIEVTELKLEPMGTDMKGIAPVTFKPIEVTEETRDGRPGYLITVSGEAPADAHGFLGGAVRFKARTRGDAEFVERELSIGGRVMTEQAEKALPTAPRRR